MRDIKFRGRKTAGQWVTGGYHKNDDGKVFIIAGSYPNKLVGWCFIEVDPSTVGQFTGLLDRNGKEIWEGDVCNCPDTGVDGKIVFHNGRFTWTDVACHWDLIYNAKDGQPKDVVVTEVDDLVVIGNIHDHPDLLK